MILILLIPQASATWWNSSWDYRVDNILPGITKNSTIIYISNSTGTNNASYFFCNGHCNPNYTDVRPVLDNTTVLPYWIEYNSSTAGIMWVNVTGATSGSHVVNLYYGNPDVTVSTGNGTETFKVFYDLRSRSSLPAGWTSSGTINYFADGITVSEWGYALTTASYGNNINEELDAGINMKTDADGNSHYLIGYSDTVGYDGAGSDSVGAQVYSSVYNAGMDYLAVTNDVPTDVGEFGILYNLYGVLSVIHDGANGDAYFYKNYTDEHSTSSGAPNLNLQIGINNNQGVGTGNDRPRLAWIRLRDVPAATLGATWGTEINQVPVLIYPGNGSTISFDYPPQTEDINFSWDIPNEASAFDNYNIMVAKDVNFNVLSVDEVVSTNYSVQTLQGTQLYWWRVRTYNSSTGVYGDWSKKFSFTLQASTTSTGGGIQGVVYELVNEVNTPIDQATVYIYNNTWSSLQVTGTNGYYLFSSLSNGTYNIYAVKNGYDTTATFPVSVNGSTITNDILMKIYISPYVPNFVFEKFIVRGLFDNSYPGVTVTVYKGSDALPHLTGTTDTMGQAVFQLIKDQRYRVTFSGGGVSGTITVYIFAKEESYYVRILTGFPTGGDRFSDISTNLTSVTINSTWSNLTLIYNDTRLSTSIVNFYAKNLSTNVTCNLNSTSSVITLGCPVYAAGLYQFGFNATSSVYGTFQEDNIINFDVGKPSTPSIDIDVDQTLLNWGSVILIVFTAALFSVRTVKFGAVIVPLEALVLWVFGWFEPLGGNATGSFLLLSIAVVIGVMVYLRQSEIKVNY